MRCQYGLLKLRAETIQDLKVLRSEMGRAVLDDLVSEMIRVMRDYRSRLKEKGWDFLRRK